MVQIFESGGLLSRAKSLIPLLVPLFLSSFRRADDLAMAMEARCYRGGDERTRMKQLVMTSRDYFAFVIIILFSCVYLQSFLVGGFMRNLKLVLAYDGTGYHGFQIQKGTGLPTIQGTFRTSL